MKKFIFGLGIVVAVLTVGGIAYASIPATNGTISGCYRTSNPARGAVIVIDAEAGEVCPSGTAPLAWNQTGPQGPPGLSGVHVVTETENFVDANGAVGALTNCPTGEVALSGGWFHKNDGLNTRVNRPAVDSNGQLTAWEFYATGGIPGSRVITLAVCAVAN